MVASWWFDSDSMGINGGSMGINGGLMGILLVVWNHGI